MGDNIIIVGNTEDTKVLAEKKEDFILVYGEPKELHNKKIKNRISEKISVVEIHLFNSTEIERLRKVEPVYEDTNIDSKLKSIFFKFKQYIKPSM